MSNRQEPAPGEHAAELATASFEEHATEFDEELTEGRAEERAEELAEDLRQQRAPRSLPKEPNGRATSSPRNS